MSPRNSPAASRQNRRVDQHLGRELEVQQPHARHIRTINPSDAKKYKDEMGKLGNNKADLEKLKALDAKYVEKLKIYLPYIEACEKFPQFTTKLAPIAPAGGA